MQGVLCRGPATPDTELVFGRRVLCAVIVKAIEDAQRGDVCAQTWLDDTGRQWCELLGIPAGDWQAAGSRLPAARRLEAERRERDRGDYWRERYARNKDDPAYQERQRENKERYLAKRRAELGKAGNGGRVLDG
jgi:hypothetical protein